MERAGRRKRGRGGARVRGTDRERKLYLTTVIYSIQIAFQRRER